MSSSSPYFTLPERDASSSLGYVFDPFFHLWLPDNRLGWKFDGALWAPLGTWRSDYSLRPSYDDEVLSAHRGVPSTLDLELRSAPFARVTPLWSRDQWGYDADQTSIAIGGVKDRAVREN